MLALTPRFTSLSMLHRAGAGRPPLVSTDPPCHTLHSHKATHPTVAATPFFCCIFKDILGGKVLAEFEGLSS